MKNQSIIRLGAGFGLAGAALGVVVNLLHPRTPEAGALPQFEMIADSTYWDINHYAALLAIVFFVGGFFALERYADDTAGFAWARLALFAAVVGAAVGAVLIAVDGYALKALADHWADVGRPTEGPAYEAVNVAREFGIGLFNVFTGTAIGFAPILGGIATIKSGRFSGWIGAFGIVGGVIGVGVDLYQVTAGLTVFSSNVAFTAAALIVTVWGVVVNWTMFRYAREPATVVEPGAATT